MLTVKPVYKLSNVSDDLKWTTDTIYTHYQGITNNIYGFGRPFLLLILLPVHPYYYPSIFVFTHPNDGYLHKAMLQNKLNRTEYVNSSMTASHPDHCVL